MSVELLEKLLLNSFELSSGRWYVSPAVITDLFSFLKDPSEGHAEKTLLWKSVRGSDAAGGEVHVCSRELTDVRMNSFTRLCCACRGEAWGEDSGSSLQICG